MKHVQSRGLLNLESDIAPPVATAPPAAPAPPVAPAPPAEPAPAAPEAAVFAQVDDKSSVLPTDVPLPEDMDVHAPDNLTDSVEPPTQSSRRLVTPPKSAAATGHQPIRPTPGARGTE
ncbi:hypothetical protein MTO96_026741 [Rhipicephalus appendiculatus]